MAKVDGFTARVPGHGLLREGRYIGPLLDSPGYPAQCSCGATEPVQSQAQARRWHRHHKSEVASAAVPPRRARPDGQRP